MMLFRLSPFTLLFFVTATRVFAQIGEPPGPGWHYLMTTGPDRYGSLRVVNDTVVLTVNRPNDSIPNYHVILFSADHGVTWDSMPPLPQVYDWEWPPGKDGLHPLKIVRSMLDTSYRFMQTFDMGKTWVEIGRFPDAMARYFIDIRGGGSYIRNPADPNQIWVGFTTDGGRGTIEGLYVRSKDNCKTWQSVRFPLPTEGLGAVYNLLFDRTDPRIWYVAVAPYSESNLAAVYYQTTDDGETFTRVNHWAKDAGIAYAGEMRSLSHSQQDVYGGKVDEYTGMITDTGWNLGFNSYSPFDPPKVTPTFVDLFGKLSVANPELVQFVGRPEYLSSPKHYRFATVEFKPPYSSPLQNYRAVVAVTNDDASTWKVILDIANRFVSDAIDPGTGRYFARIPRDSTIVHSIFPPSDSFDYWYTDQFRSQLGAVWRKNAAQQIEFFVSPSIVTKIGQVVISLPKPSPIGLTIWDAAGQPVGSINTSNESSEQTVPFDRDILHLVAGVYFLRLATVDRTAVTKFIVR